MTMKTLLISILTLFLSLTALAQSRTVSQFLEKYEPSASFYLYPSTLRMINRDNNRDYQKLVRHIKKLSFLTYEKAQNNLNQSSITRFRDELTKEQYEELLSFRDAGNQVFVYARGNNPEAYVSLVDNEETLMMFDMQGAPDLPSLMRLVQSDFNFGMIAEMANVVGDINKSSKSDDH
jgi:hypothetical protein